MEEFTPDSVVAELEKFLNGDFKAWCKAHSMEPFDAEDEAGLKRMVKPFATEADGSFIHFREVANKLEGYVTEYAKEHGSNYVPIALLMGKITRIKEKYEGPVTNGWIAGILKEINKDAEKYCEGEEDYVDEYTGKVLTVKKFKKEVPYAYDWNVDMYRIYFKLVTRDLWFLLKSYAEDYKDGRIPPTSAALSPSGKEYTKELIIGSIAHLKRERKLPLSLKVYDEKAKASLARCFKTLSHHDQFVEKNQETTFINLFSKEPVNMKVIWNGTKIELAYFIEGIKGSLDIKDNRWFGGESCFEIIGTHSLKRRSLIDAVPKNSVEENGKKYMVLKDAEHQAKLDEAINRFKGEIIKL